MKQLYQKAECGPSIDELVFQCENIEITVPFTSKCTLTRRLTARNSGVSAGP